MLYKLPTTPNFRTRAASINYRERAITDRMNRSRLRIGVPIYEAKGITPDDLERLLFEAKGECQWCGKLMRSTPEYDHILPLSRGGKNVIENLTVSCSSCNRRKAGKHPVRWAHEIYAKTGKITPLIAQLLKPDTRLMQSWQMSLADAFADNDDRGLKKAA